MPEPSESRVGVYIDFDNVVISRYDQLWGRGDFMRDREARASVQRHAFETPQEQIGYLAVRKWARRYTPDVLLGVYTPEELMTREVHDMGSVDEVPSQSEPRAAARGSSVASPCA